MSGTLHFICGRLASGKTTLARKIAEHEHAIFFCEDLWLSRLSDGIANFEDYLKWSRRCRSVMGPLIVDLLKSGTSVVLDFAGNTPSERRWVRSLFEEASAQHILYFLAASEETCLAQLKKRNEQKTDGCYFAEISEEDFVAITKYFHPPAEQERFHIKLEA